ncbi:MAG TPA: recombination regulator RecX [Burkholderiales bacterium]|jgi:regulatory protein
MRREPGLRERALRLLARREHSRAELARKLQAHAGPEDGLEALLDDLTLHKLLSNERYAEARTRALSRRFGAARIAHDLRASGVEDHLAEVALKTARATEAERAQEVWRRKFRTAPKTREERAKQMRFLQSRGFSFDAIRAVVGGKDE